MAQPGSTSKQWRFFRAGGFDQVKLETGADLMALDQLDLKLWVALACPASGLEIDRATLALIDTDNDGRMDISLSRTDKYESAYTTTPQKGWLGLMHQKADGMFEIMDGLVGVKAAHCLRIVYSSRMEPTLACLPAPSCAMPVVRPTRNRRLISRCE